MKFSESEKWVPIFLMSFISILLLAAFVCAWIDDERYRDMVRAVSGSIGDLKVVFSILLGSGFFYSNQRQGYKNLMIQKNGIKPEEISK